MSGKPLLNPGKNWSSKASEVLRCVPRDHLSELLFSAHENSIMKGGRIPSLHVFFLCLHCWLADGLSVTIVLFKKSGRHNLQDYSYIMVSHIWKTKEKKNILWSFKLPLATCLVYPNINMSAHRHAVLPIQWSQAEKPEMSWSILSPSAAIRACISGVQWDDPSLRSLFYSSCSTPSNCGEVRDGSSHSLITAVLSFLPQSRKTPRKTPNCEARMIGNTLSPRLKARKLL